MPKKKGLDLSTLDTVAGSKEGAECELKHPVSGDGIGVYVRVVGPDSPVFRSAQHKGQNAALKRAIAKNKSIDFDDLESRRVDVITECTLGWRSSGGDYVTVDGENLEYSKENAKKVYERFPWMVEQLDSFIVDRGNFIKG